jgi:hypothetical protein
MTFTTENQPQRRARGKGYKLPREDKPVTADAKWMTAAQLRRRYGGMSHMWIERNLKKNPDFPRPRFQGRLRLFLVAEFDAYDKKLITKAMKGDDKS